MICASPVSIFRMWISATAPTFLWSAMPAELQAGTPPSFRSTLKYLTSDAGNGHLQKRYVPRKQLWYFGLLAVEAVVIFSECRYFCFIYNFQRTLPLTMQSLLPLVILFLQYQCMGIGFKITGRCVENCVCGKAVNQIWLSRVIWSHQLAGKVQVCNYSFCQTRL